MSKLLPVSECGVHHIIWHSTTQTLGHGRHTCQLLPFLVKLAAWAAGAKPAATAGHSYPKSREPVMSEACTDYEDEDQGTDSDCSFGEENECWELLCATMAVQHDYLGYCHRCQILNNRCPTCETNINGLVAPKAPTFIEGKNPKKCKTTSNIVHKRFQQKQKKEEGRESEHLEKNIGKELITTESPCVTKESQEADLAAILEETSITLKNIHFTQDKLPNTAELKVSSTEATTSKD